MKTVKNLLLLSLVFLGLVACKQKTETSQADNSVSGEAQEQSEAGAELAQETDTQEATSFEKTLSLQGSHMQLVFSQPDLRCFAANICR